MPVFDAWGIVPAGNRGPRPNPWAAEPEYMDESPKPEEVEESGGEEASRGADPSSEDEASRSADPVGEGEASRGADPSRGSAGSSRSAPAEVDLQVISSSDEEDAFRVARSRRVGEEEETSGSGGGRCEPRSKAIHDRRAAVARSAPHEEARAPQEEAGASNTQPPKAKKRVWRMVDE